MLLSSICKVIKIAIDDTELTAEEVEEINCKNETIERKEERVRKLSSNFLLTL